jgi:Tfp pilus assembly protein PilN
MRSPRLRIDFAPGVRRGPRAGRWLLATGLVLLALVAAECTRVLAQGARATASLQAAEARRAAAQAPAPAVRPEARQVAMMRATRQVASDLATPWSRLLSALGSTTARDVALLGVEPSVAKRSVRLTAEARDADAMLAYLAELQRDGRLSSVVLVSHQLQAQAPGSPIRFQVQAQWGDAP